MSFQTMANNIKLLFIMVIANLFIYMWYWNVYVVVVNHNGLEGLHLKIKSQQQDYQQQNHYQQPQQQQGQPQHQQQQEQQEPQRHHQQRCTPEDRIERVHHFCENKNSSVWNKLPDTELIAMSKSLSMLVDDKHKLVVCVPPKSGCSTWKTILANNSAKGPLPHDFDIQSLHNGGVKRYGFLLMT